MNHKFRLRQATESDFESISQLFYETVQEINKKDYSQVELDDWSSSINNKEKWITRIREQYFILALTERELVGFSSIAKDGYLDLMYTHKDFQSKGIAKIMLTELETKAKKQNNTMVYSDVSITAKDFFLSQGYKEEKENLKQPEKKYLINYRMYKSLT